MKKIAAILLTFLMLISVVPMTMAAEAGVIVGDTTLFAPPVGVRSAVSYTLYDTAGGTEQTDAALTISGTIPDGVSVKDNKLVLNGSLIEAGTFTVTLANDSYSASQTVTVSNVRIYDDFESFTTDDAVGSTATLKNLDGTANSTSIYSGVTNTIAESNGKKYVSGGVTANFKSVTGIDTAREITVSAKIKADISKDYEQLVEMKNQHEMIMINMHHRSNSNYWISTRNQSGATSNVSSWSTAIPTADFEKVSWELDGHNRTYVTKHKDTTLFTDAGATGVFQMVDRNWTIAAYANGEYVGYFVTASNISEIAVFSGVEIEPLTYDVIGDSVLYAPPVGVRSAVSYSLVSSEGENLGGNVSISNAPNGVSLKDNKIVLDGSKIQAGTFNVTVTSGDVSQTKEVTVSNVRIYDDFESFTTGSAVGSTATLKNLDGTANATSIYSGVTNTIAESNGKKYVSGGVTANFKSVTGIDTAREITVSAKIKADISKDYEQLVEMKNQHEMIMINMHHRSNSNYWISTRNQSGATSNVSSWSTAIPTADFEKVSWELDGHNRTYVTKHKDTTLFTDAGATGVFQMVDRNWTIAAYANGEYVGYFVTASNISEIAVFSGVEIPPVVGSITGEATLYAPPVGEYSEISYDLFDDQGAAVTSGYTMNISGAPVGVTLTGNKIILNGSAIQAGTFKLTAEASGLTATKEITVADLRIYNDYEDSEVYVAAEEGSAITIAGKAPWFKLSGERATSGGYQGSAILATEGSNHYTSGEVIYRPDWTCVSKSTEKTVVSAKIRPVMTATSGSKTIDLYYTNGSGNVHFMQIQLGADRIWKSSYDKDGANNPVITGKYCEDKWVDVRIELDFVGKTYTVYIDNEVIFEDYKIKDFVTGSYVLNNIITANDVDNFAIYSGELLKGALSYDAFEVKVDGETVSDYNNCITPGTKLLVSADVSNSNGNARDLVMIVAEYGKNGEILQFESLTSVNGSVVAVSSEKVEKEITIGADTETVKVFVWKPGTLIPLGNSLTLN